MPKLPRLTVTFYLFFLLSITAIAQTSVQTPLSSERESAIDAAPHEKQTLTQPSSSIIITATASGQRVRFVSIGEVNQTRLQVFSADGAQVFDSSYRLGNLIDWQLTDQQGQRLAAGSYLFLVTVRDFSGALTQKYGTAHLEQALVSLEQTSGAELPQSQSAALEANKVSATLSVVDRVGAAAINPSAATSTEEQTADAQQSPGTENIAGTGTTNTLAKWIDNAGTLGNSAAVEVGGNVGIGTAAPNYRLVVGPALQSGFTAAAMTVSRGAGLSSSILVGSGGPNAMEFGWDNTNARAFLNAPGTSPIALSQNGANVRMFITSEGNIGVGTTNPRPGVRLDVAGHLGVSGAGNGIVFPDGTVQTTAGVIHNNTLTGTGTLGSALGVAVPLSLTGSSDTTPILSVKNTSTTTTPGDRTAIYGESFSSDGKGVYGRAYGGANAIGVYGAADSGFGVAGQSASGHGVFGQTIFGGRSAAGVRGFAGSENGIGVYGEADQPNGWGVYGRSNSNSGAAGFFEGHVAITRNLSFEGQPRQMINLSSTQYAIGVQPFTQYFRTANHFGWYKGGTHSNVELDAGGGVKLMSLDGTSGNLTVTGSVCAANIACASDVRLKQGITTLNYGLTQLMRLRPVSWHWKAQPEGTLQMGLVAQEVEGVMPELVLREADAGKPLGLNYMALLPVAIKAIQEQQSQIQQQKNLIEQLRAQLSQQQAQLNQVKRTLRRNRAARR
jgi:hypothetical protein